MYVNALFCRNLTFLNTPAATDIMFYGIVMEFEFIS